MDDSGSIFEIKQEIKLEMDEISISEEINDTDKKCFLCNSGGSTKDFIDKTFENCSLKLAFRKMKSFKYKDVELTNASLDFVGYHTTCYKKVTVLSNKYNEEFNRFAAKNTVRVADDVKDEISISEEIDDTVQISIKKEIDIYDSYEEDMEHNRAEPSTSAACVSSEATCLFCDRERLNGWKRVLHLKFARNRKAVQKIRDMAESLDDSNVLSKLENETIAYHQSCYAEYHLKEKKSTDKRAVHEYRNVHTLAFESLCNFITTEIIENNKVMNFAELFSRYETLLLEFGNCEINVDDIQDPETLKKKIIKKFKYDRSVYWAS